MTNLQFSHGSLVKRFLVSGRQSSAFFSRFFQFNKKNDWFEKH
jgi:hypothetical protein